MNTNSSSLLDVQNLSIDFQTKDGVFHAAKDVSFSINKGETLSLIGESGSGKSITALSILKLLPYPMASHPSGKILYKGDDLLKIDDKRLRRIRGEEIGMIFQEPMTSLNPLHTIEKQIAEPMIVHEGMSQKDARKRVMELLDLVQMSRLKSRLNAYPHELSGGQRQRVMIAMTLTNDPSLLIADEPTTALDVTVQAEILKLLDELKKELDMAMLFISHDLNLVKTISDKVCVMKDGIIRESGTANTVFSKPKDDYTKKLLAAEPSGTAIEIKNKQTLVKADHIDVKFAMDKSFFGKTKNYLHAVNDVSFDLNTGETLGIVGESGSGKTTLGMSLLKLQNYTGKVTFDGKPISELSKKKFLPIRKDIQVVFQDPFGSLSPRMSVGQIIAEGLTVHRKDLSKEQRDDMVIKVLKEVELDPAARHRYPHEFSGGQRQRISIARALVMEPKLIILDEPTSALDMSVQVSILDLLKKLQQEKGLTYIFISHDLRVVRAISHKILVMKDGKIVEQGSAKDVFESPKQEYTQKLFKAAFLEELSA
ncbi:MAG: microcin ABC transporter ATP-binding protein [Micavibrio sp.]|nr:microcin ABC transporter ATP-binding protein [Micavibrio sp.]